MQYKSSFEIKEWEVAQPDGVGELADVSRATIRKAFTGELEGSSIAYGLLMQTPSHTGGYVVVERVSAKAGGREGTFVILHYGINDGDSGGPWHGDVVPGSGTDGFAGVTGKFAIEHGEGVAAFTWDLSFG